MLSATSFKKVSFLKPVLPLVPETQSKSEEDQKKTITMELKSQAGTAGSATYKKKITLFDEGTPQEWIDTQRDIFEVWRQNAITAPEDRVSIFKAVLRGETLSHFETVISEITLDENDDPVALTMAMVTKALADVSNTIFPHRALESQRQWMRKSLKKPHNLTTRQTAVALSRINSCLPLFPGGSEDTKFTASELLEILECSLPYAWRQKLDYDGYVPTDWDKATLIASCEAIERNLDTETGDKKQKQQQGKKQEKPAKRRKQNPRQDGKASKGEFHCTEHGQNMTHDTADCYTLKSKAKAEATKPSKYTFSNKGLRKEINLMAKQSSKEKVLDLYASVISKEKAKLKKAKQKKDQTPSEMDAGSESDASSYDSMALIESASEEEDTEQDHELDKEELAYLCKLHNSDESIMGVLNED